MLQTSYMEVPLSYCGIARDRPSCAGCGGKSLGRSVKRVANFSHLWCQRNYSTLWLNHLSCFSLSLYDWMNENIYTHCFILCFRSLRKWNIKHWVSWWLGIFHIIQEQKHKMKWGMRALQFIAPHWDKVASAVGNMGRGRGAPIPPSNQTTADNLFLLTDW